MTNPFSPTGLVWIDGKIVAESEARVSILDHGFLYGDSVYEAVRTFGGRPFLLEEHMMRLAHSAAGVGIPLPDNIVAAIDAVLAGAPGDRLLRIILTRGVGPMGYALVDDQPPTLIVMSRPVPTYTVEQYRDGISLSVVGVRRNSRQSLDPSLKTSNLLNVRLAYMEARRAGADDAVMLNARGEVAEASGSNVFAVHGELLWTPPTDAGILQGCTRAFVLERVAPLAGVTVRQDPMPLASLESADEIFITSTTRSILPVSRLDGRAVGGARRGPVTLRLMRQFEQLVGTPVFPAGAL